MQWNKYLLVILAIVGASCILLMDTSPKMIQEPSQHISSESGDAPENPKEREEWWKEMMGPGPSIQQIRAAQKYISKQFAQSGRGAYRDAGINGWNDLGPKNIGGRIRAIAINPNDANEIFVGAVAGGVWRSADGGSTWNEVTPSLLAYPVTSIAVDPMNSNNIYAATGELIGGSRQPGIGVLKSTNGGNSWEITNGPPMANFFWLSKIVINPLDPNILYACGTAANQNQNGALGTVYRSDDQGDNWYVLWSENISPVSSNVFDIELNPSDTSKLIVGTFLQTLYTNDSGNSWTSFMGSAPLIVTAQNTQGFRCETAYCQSSASTIYVLRDVRDTSVTPSTPITELWRTQDGGSNWSLLSSTSGTDPAVNILKDQGSYDNALWVDPSNCSRAVMGGINLWRWTNSGLLRISEWTDDIDGNALGGNNSAHADQHIIVPDPGYNGTSNNRVYYGNDGGIYKTENVWTATLNSGWSALNTELNITQLYGVDVSRTGDTLVGGAQDNSYFVDRTANGNDLGWGVYSTGDGGHCAINKSNPEIMYSSIQNGNVFKSSDGGDSFCRMVSLNGSSGIACGNILSLNDTAVFIAPVEMDPNDDRVLYVGGRNLWRTLNEGTTWTSLFTSIGTSITTIEIAQSNSNHIWIGLQNGDIWRSTNNGASWAPLGNSVLPDDYVGDIAVNPNDPNSALITLSRGFRDSCIWYTNDGGTNWQLRDLDTPIRIQCATWHPAYVNWVYVGTAYGIFASEDAGQNWSVTPFYNETEGPVYAATLELVWQGDGTAVHPYYMVAATHGRGVWRSRAPIFNKYYVDKNCTTCGLGTFSRPFATFKEAVNAAGSGTEIIILSGGTYNEIPSTIFMDRRIRITLDPQSSSSAVIE